MMRSTSTLPLVLLLSLTATSFCAPIPVSVEECSHYVSCRHYRQQPITQSKASPSLQEPHFPNHQLESLEHADTVEVRLLEHHVTTPTLFAQDELPIKNSMLNPVLKAKHRDKESAKKKPHQLEHKKESAKATDSELAISQSYSPSSNDREDKKYSFTASVIEKVQLIAITGGQKCGIMSGTAHAKDKQGDGRMTVTYTYEYSYKRTEHSSILVVSIVVIFVLAVILVELLDKVIKTMKALLGFDQGAIRLEDCDCERGDLSPPYTYSPKPFRLMPAPPPRAARSTTKPKSTPEEIQKEKSQLLG